jgi:hypothetical protein
MYKCLMNLRVYALMMSSILLLSCHWNGAKVSTVAPAQQSSTSLVSYEPSFNKASFSLRYLYRSYFDKPHLKFLADSAAASAVKINDSLAENGKTVVAAPIPYEKCDLMIARLFPDGNPVRNASKEATIEVTWYGACLKHDIEQMGLWEFNQAKIGLFLKRLPAICAFECVDSIRPPEPKMKLN